MPGVRWSAIAHVARNDIRLMLRDRGTVFWSFVGPFLFMMFFGVLFRDVPAEKSSLTIRNVDTSPAFATALTVLLRADSVSVKNADGATDPADTFVLVIPVGSSDSLQAGRLPHLVLRTPEDNPTPREQTLRAQTLRAILGAFLGLTPADLHATLDEAAVRARVVFEPTIRLDRRKLAYAPPSFGFQHTVPAYLVMFLLMSLMTSGAEILIAERRAGQLRRAQVSSTAASEILCGKFLSRFAFAWIQIAAMLGVGILVFHVRFGTHPEALFACLAAIALCATGMGLLFATLFRNADKAGGFGSLIVMAMAALGGCWWPLEIVPGWMRKVAFLLPTGWGYDGLNRVMALNSGLRDIVPHVAVLLGIAAVTLWLSIRRLSRVDS
jgi:ABC-2 type transport system permease protein